MWWEQLKEWITWFFNLTLPVVCISVGALLFFGWKVLMTTSFGKKIYAKVEKDFNNLQSRSDAFIEDTKNEIKSIKEECDAKVKALSEYYENMLAQKQAKEDEMEKFMLAIADCIHNEQVKSLVLEYKNKMNGYRTIMTDKINEVKADYETRLHALEEKLYGEERIDHSSEEEKI